MEVIYDGLWRMLKEKRMFRKDLITELGISSATLAKMSRGENVSMEVLQKICILLNCDVGDIVSFRGNGEEHKND